MEIPCSDTESLLFERIAESAARMQMEVYVIGGFVRDKIIGRPTSDADIVCVGNAIDRAHGSSTRAKFGAQVADFQKRRQRQFSPLNLKSG
jgi:poly(A) polymerase